MRASGDVTDGRKLVRGRSEKSVFSLHFWFDDRVIATEHVGPIHGKLCAGKKKSIPSKSALLTRGLLIVEPSESVFVQEFEEGLTAEE